MGSAAKRQQWAVRQNASNGQVTPLLYSSNAADGGSYGLSLQAQAQLANAKNGGANFNDGIAREQNVAYNANQVMGNDNVASIAAYFGKGGNMATNLAAEGKDNATSLKPQTKTLTNGSLITEGGGLIELGVKLAPAISETLSRGGTALVKAAGAQKLLPARSLQQAHIEKVMVANEIKDAQAVIKGANAKSAVAMVESAAKLGKFTKGVAFVGDAATFIEESQRLSRAVGAVEQRQVVQAGATNYILSKGVSTGGAVGGAYIGAGIGSIVPGPGTIVGAAIGGIAGAVFSGLGYDEAVAPVVRAKIAGEKFRDDK